MAQRIHLAPIRLRSVCSVVMRADGKICRPQRRDRSQLFAWTSVFGFGSEPQQLHELKLAMKSSIQPGNRYG